MIQRSTRVLAHPDGSYTVQFTHEMRVSDGRELSLPKTVKQWVDDPGFAVQPGFVGQHLNGAEADARAYVISEAPSLEELYATFGKMYLRDDDKTPSGQVN